MKKFAALTLLFFCTIVFSATSPAFAHHGVTAKEASAGDMDDMRNFLLHMKEHREPRVTSDEGRVEFRNALRNNNGVWRHGATYVITVNKSTGGEATDAPFQSGDIILFHGRHPGALSGSLRGIPVFRRLMDMAEGAGDEVVCVQDDRTGRGGRHICAVGDSDTGEAGDSFIHVGGFDHELREADHSKSLDACPDLSGKGWLSADMVNDESSLVRYLEGVEAHITEEFAKVGNSRGRLPLMRMIQLMPCWREPPWQSGSIYFYIVTGTDKMYGIFNGNSPQLQDRSLRLVDDNGVEVAKRILEEVDRQDDTPGEGFLTYLWEDPTVIGDEVLCEETAPASGPSPEDEDVFCEAGNPIPGRSPGTSVKIGYFIRTDFGIEGGTKYVLGSGIYPGSEQAGSGGSDGSGGGGGCAIASGSGNEFEAGTFNLFLIAAVLFLAASVGRRLGATQGS
ncbi:MAG: hypothetical protein OXK19_07495 [Candidatus Dadabacteria bacterium]|nr:hypothetical protein [Candidatus Dadabacteria bacterium]